MINDKLIWNDKNDKKKGYKIRNGNGVIKHKLGKKTSYHPIITSLIVWWGDLNGLWFIKPCSFTFPTTE